MMAGSFRARCEHAHGLRAGAIIAALGGLCAERKATMEWHPNSLSTSTLDRERRSGSLGSGKTENANGGGTDG
jgi:hypothetical protein